jgi:hypothetical protein
MEKAPVLYETWERLSVRCKPWEWLSVCCKPWELIPILCKPRVYVNKAYGPVELLLQPHINLDEMEELVCFMSQSLQPRRKD